jgi:hypothetical protein
MSNGYQEKVDTDKMQMPSFLMVITLSDYVYEREDGQWKTLVPNAAGAYTIPKGEITDKVTIEYR